MKQFNELLTAYTEAAMTAALYADQDSAAAAATWAAVANDHRQRLLARIAELEAQLAAARRWQNDVLLYLEQDENSEAVSLRVLAPDRAKGKS